MSRRDRRQTGYAPFTTLGRIPVKARPEELMASRIAQLDALLIVVSTSLEDEVFSSCNYQIRQKVLELASSLAEEIHDIHAELTRKSVKALAAAMAAARAKARAAADLQPEGKQHG